MRFLKDMEVDSVRENHYQNDGDRGMKKKRKLNKKDLAGDREMPKLKIFFPCLTEKLYR